MTTDAPDLIGAAQQIQTLTNQLGQARADLATRDTGLEQALADLDSQRATTAALHNKVTTLTRQAEADQVASARAAARPATGPHTYPDLRSWVDGWLIPNTERDIGTRQRWCTQWPHHPEAVWRLTALWQDYERTWAKPDSGVTMFARNSLAHHLGELLNPTGPFSGCSPERHEPIRTLPDTHNA